MKDANDDLELLELAPELERYELFADPVYNFDFDRRQFLKVFSGGIALIVPMSNLVARAVQQDQGESGQGRFNQRVPNEIGAWIHVDEKGMVSVFTGKVEIGQNIHTSLAQAVAEELHVPINTVRLVMADTDLVNASPSRNTRPVGFDRRWHGCRRQETLANLHRGLHRARATRATRCCG